MRSPNGSLLEEPFILIAGVSGRALAQSAKRSGFRPLVVDCFADEDMRKAAFSWRKIGYSQEEGFLGEEDPEAPDDQALEMRPLIKMLKDLSREAFAPPIGVVCGGGFEARPEYLDEISEHWPLIGNDRAQTAAVNSPDIFFPALKTLGIKAPETRLQWPRGSRKKWLSKQIGGAGGGHIKPLYGTPVKTRLKPVNVYYQRQREGRSISALFLADGAGSQLIGCSEQWVTPLPHMPYTYGGALRPADLSSEDLEEIRLSVAKIVKKFKIKGLGSVDFLVAREGQYVLEMNPRPSATLDLFDGDDVRLFGAHVQALSGLLSEPPPPAKGAFASAILYAYDDFVVPKTIEWPDGVRDRPHGLEKIKKNHPICTATGRGESAQDALQDLKLHVELIHQQLGIKKEL